MFFLSFPLSLPLTGFLSTDTYSMSNIEYVSVVLFCYFYFFWMLCYVMLCMKNLKKNVDNKKKSVFLFLFR